MFLFKWNTVTKHSSTLVTAYFAPKLFVFRWPGTNFDEMTGVDGVDLPIELVFTPPPPPLSIEGRSTNKENFKYFMNKS